MNVRNMLAAAKNANQDFEWYPTTTEILEQIWKHIKNDWVSTYAGPLDDVTKLSIIDVGCGPDARAAFALSPHGKKYVIEKSEIFKKELCKISNNVLPIGNDFWATSLWPVQADLLFCNPPYSEFADWMEKIIKTANVSRCYFVVPQRWRNNKNLEIALDARNAKVDSLGFFNFQNAERAARAEVEVVCIKFRKHLKIERGVEDSDPFLLIFKEMFPKACQKAEKIEIKIEEDTGRQELIATKGLLPFLLEEYMQEMQEMQENFKKMTEMPLNVRKVFDLDINSLAKKLQLLLQGLHLRYWKSLFQHYTPITSRLCNKQRQRMLSALSDINLAFSEENAYQITQWAINSATEFIDEQIINVMDKLFNQENMASYKSNPQIFKGDSFRFNVSNFSHYYLKDVCKGLDYRIILDSYGRLKGKKDLGWQTTNGMADIGIELIDDLITLSQCLGYPTPTGVPVRSRYWTEGCTYDVNGKAISHEFFVGDVLLLHAKGTFCGSLHLKINSEFLQKLTVVYSKIKGWISSPEEANHEMGISMHVCKSAFSQNLLPAASDRLLLQG